MIFRENLIGKIVIHKLLGRCIIIEAYPKEERSWTIRLKNGKVLIVKREELKEPEEKSEKLRKMGKMAIALGKMAIKESALDN